MNQRWFKAVIYITLGALLITTVLMGLGSLLQ